MFRLFLAVPIVLIGCSGVFASCGHVAAPYVQEVVTPIAVPVFIPTFQFQYQPPICAPAQVAQPVVQSQSGYQMGQAQAPAAQQQPSYGLTTDRDRVRALAKALLDEMNKQVDGSAAPAQDDGPPMVPDHQLRAFSAVTSPGPLTSSQISILSNHCYSCHSRESHKGNFTLFDGPGRLNPTVDPRKVWEQISQGKMPPANQPRLNQSELQTLYAWAYGGR